MEAIKEISQNKYFIAFVASLVQCFWMWFKFKNKKDAGKIRMTWKVYRKKFWDDYVAAILIPIFLVFVYEYIYTLVVYLMDLQDPWDFFFETEEASSVVFGLFGVLIYTKLMSKGKDRINRI